MPLYLIEFIGRYEMKDGTLSKRKSSFTAKNSHVDFKIGGTVIHNGKFFHIEKIFFSKIR